MKKELQKNINTNTQIAIFRGKKIRKIIYQNEWWFSVVDVIEVLTDSVNSNDYWYKMKIRVKSEDGIELSTFCRQLKLKSADGKFYETDCANTEGIFRIIQSIPSPKAEPFKRWLAKVGTENSQGLPKLKSDAMAGGKIAGDARRKLEKRLKRSTVSKENYLRGGNKIKKLPNKMNKKI